MKTLKSIATVFALLTSVLGIASNNDTLTNELPRDVQVNLTARVYEGKVYINLTMLNESKPGVYSLVKTYDDGSFESVSLKDVGVNTINRPLLYSFSDNPLESKPYSYVLVRISHSAEVVGTWYCSYFPDIPNGVCVDEAIFAVNTNEWL